MSQQYGFRATSNFQEVEDRDACIQNLGIDAGDLLLIEGTSSAGVDSGDYKCISGLQSSLNDQLVTLSGEAIDKISELNTKATINGSTFTGSVLATSINNDRPFVQLNNTIVGPSTTSYFSPRASGLFATGGEYKLGPVTATTFTSSGVTYTGELKPWNNAFVKYTQAVRFQEQPSWTVRRSPLYLPPPTALSGCALWLDTEYSEVLLDQSDKVIQWRGVNSELAAANEFAARRPLFVPNAVNGRPKIAFTDSSETFLTIGPVSPGDSDFSNTSLGDIGYLFPNAATLVVAVAINDSNYNIFGTLNNVANRWNGGAGTGSFGVFTTTLQTGFPTGAVSSGTFVFTVRISNSYGLQVRQNAVLQDYKSPGTFQYTGDGVYEIARSAGNSGFFDGDIYSMAFFNRVLSDKETRTMEEYFAFRYAITL